MADPHQRNLTTFIKINISELLLKLKRPKGQMNERLFKVIIVKVKLPLGLIN
jgi:hypothetical protein